MRERAGQWAEPPSHQPVERCVEHLIHMMIVHCQGRENRKAADLALSEKQVRIGLMPRRGSVS